MGKLTLYLEVLKALSIRRNGGYNLMEKNNHALTPSEILSLWNVYLSETMTTHVTTLFLEQAEDPEIKDLLEIALKVSKEGVAAAESFLKNAGHPLPDGFSEHDINWSAPKKYSDHFVLLIKNKLVQDAVVVSTMALGSSTRKDIRNFFEKQLQQGSRIINICLDLIYKKGLYHPLHIPFPEESEKISSSQSFLGSFFVGTRPVSTAEIFNLVANFQSTEVLSVFFKSFAQFELSKENGIKQHFERGAEIMDKHLEIFQTLLSKNNLPQLPTWESELTDSIIAPFSEKVILFKSSLMLSATASRYGVALSTVVRKDIGVDFMRLMVETLKYAEDTINLLIKKKYLTQHPLALTK